MKNPVGQTLLNQFQVESFIASGGMGAVYRVWDLKRNVDLAMKVLHEDLAEDPSIIKRFKREARALKKLTHPNIVPFYGLFEAEGLTFLLESYVDGPSLKELLKYRVGKPMPVQEALTFLKALSSALGYAHVNGVVHCDVKPGNVMVDQGGGIYLTDFGVARHAESTTTTLGFAGTAAYMAPEQCRGEAVTAQTDVYALGVMFFEMLTGKRPFRGDEVAAETGGSTGSERVRYAHIHLNPPDPRNYNPEIPVELSQVILKALAKNPVDRFFSSLEFYKAACAAVGLAPEALPDRILLPESFTHQKQKETLISPPPTVVSARPEPVLVEQVIPKVSQHLSRKVVPMIIGIVGILGIVVLILLLKPRTVFPSPTSTAMISTSVVAQVTETEVVVTSTSIEPTEVATIARTPTSVPAFPEPREGVIQLNPIDMAEMVYIPEVCFWMGASKADNPYVEERESPVHEVCLDGYWMYRTEVTVSQFQKFVKETGYRTRAEKQGYSMVFVYLGGDKYDWKEVQGATWVYPQGPSSPSALGNYPAEHIAWEDAAAYCQWAGMRLPTEAEWEHAARGPSNSLYPWGNSLPTGSLLNLSDKNCPGMADKSDLDDGYGRSAPVGSYRSNAYDLFDMAGNVWEWVYDWYGPYASSLEHNPTGPGRGEDHIARGGAWDYGEGAARSTYRHRPEHEAAETHGFRCAGAP